MTWWTLAACAAAAVVSVALLGGISPGSVGVTPSHVPGLLFFVGPFLVLALVAWRRRADRGASRRLAWCAAGVAGGGVVVYGWLAYRVHVGPPFREFPAPICLLVPLAQWVAVFAGWGAGTAPGGRTPPASAF